ncbi:ParB/RepB/Spo0J family partition protein [Nostoc sp.]|uniref:ParB/RepB/Spo0J family partition protein n=1 Tax=Nostoc sp. TaxID=1180 RepID=UPI003FA59581
MYHVPKTLDYENASIREHGILQPLLVRPLESGNYELIAGECRYRAAQTLGMEQVPVIIRHLNDQDAFQVALLENLQREDLNPVEETEAILQLLSIRLECSQGEVISLLNHIANLQKQKTETTNNVVRNQWEMVEKIFSVNRMVKRSSIFDFIIYYTGKNSNLNKHQLGRQ